MKNILQNKASSNKGTSIKNNKFNQPIIPSRKNLTLGQKYADALTLFVGSWKFIIGLLIFMASWMVANIFLVYYRWDPYPFILFNLVLSMLAAIQAPIILMSQNREAERDRVQQRYDYLIDRKSEREVANMQRDLDEIKDMIRKLNIPGSKKAKK